MKRVGSGLLRGLLGSAVVIAALSTLVLVGCEEDPTGPSDDDIRAAQQLVDEGFVLLAAALDQEYDLENPPDLATPKQKFEDALELDENNHDARVGLALCEIALVAQDPSVMVVLAGLMTTPLSFGKATEGKRVPFARMLGGGTDTGPELLSPGGWLAYMHGQMSKVLQEGPPDLGPLQNVIELVILPVLERVTLLFEAIEQNPEWTLVLTAELLNWEEGQLEIDVTDIYMLDAFVSGLKAMLYFFVSYDLNMPDFADTTAVQAALNQTDGTLLKLRTNGATNMGNTYESLIDGITKLGFFKTSLEGETDDQSDDLIKIDPSGDEGPSEEKLAEFSEGIATLLAVLSGPHDVEQDFDGDGTEETLSVDLSSFFTSPIQDPKQLLPPYHWNETYMTFLWDGWPEDFSLFVFPDPTMGGVLPGMTSDALFKDFFGITMWPSAGPFFFGEGGGGGN